MRRRDTRPALIRRGLFVRGRIGGMTIADYVTIAGCGTALVLNSAALCWGLSAYALRRSLAGAAILCGIAAIIWSLSIAGGFAL
jgi:hypothetical protein